MICLGTKSALFYYIVRVFISLIIFLGLMGGSILATVTPKETSPPQIKLLLKPESYNRIVENREVMTSASLDTDEAEPGKTPLKRYQFYSSMLVRADMTYVRKILLDPESYRHMIPFLDHLTFDPKTNILEMKGGIWRFKLHSFVRIEDRGLKWIHYQIIRGHFTGLVGDAYMEDLGVRGTLVYLQGQIRSDGKKWPPPFVMQRGAEIVFSFTGKKIRSHIESQKRMSSDVNRKDSNDDTIPQPRSHL